MRYGAGPTNVAELIALRLSKVPLPVLDIILGPLQARVLIAAQREGIFTALADGPADAVEIARRRTLDAECTRLVLLVLRSMGYVERVGARFALSPLGQAHFGRDVREGSAAFVEYGAPQWDMIEQLDLVLRTGRGIDLHDRTDPGEWAAYQRAMLEQARSFVWFVAKHTPVPTGARRCLDLGGAHGLVGAELCRRHPGMRSTVIDRIEALVESRALARAEGYDGLVEFRAGDLRADCFGEGHDVALVCNVLHHFSAADNLALLTRTRRALRPGGTIALFDIEAAADDAPPDAAAEAFALYFRITSASTCFPARDLVSWLREAGFEGVRVVRSLRLPRRMLVIGSV